MQRDVHDPRRILALDTAVVVLAAIARFGLGLSDEALRNWDEGLYCAATRDMLHEGQLLYPVEEGAFDAYYGKPPFLNWLHVLTTAVFGFTPFALRLPSALASMGAVVLAHRMATRMAGRGAGAFAAGLLLLSLPFAEFGRQTLLEPLLAFFTLASLGLHTKAIERRSTWLAFAAGIVVGLAVLTKQLVGALPFCAVVVGEIALRRGGALRRVGAHLFGLVLASAWWFVWVRAEVGPALEASLVETHLLQRVAGAFEAHGRRASDYAQHLSLYVWTLPFVAGAVGAVRALTMASARVPGVLLSAFAAGHYLLFGVISRNFLPWYVFAAVPVVVVLASTLFGRGSTYWVRAVLLGTVLASLAKDLGVDPVALGLFGAALAVVFDWRPVPDVVPTFVLVAAFAGSALVLRPSVVREHPARLVEAVEERETLVVLESWKQFVWRCYLPEADFQVAGRECTEVRRIVTASEARFVITAPALDRCELHHQGFKRVAIDDGYVLHVREPRGVVWEPPTPPKKLPRPRRQAQ